jgi:hypothetical protein
MMKKKAWVIVIGLSVCLLFPAARLKAVNEKNVALGNVIGSSVTTLVRGMLQGKVHGLKDAAVMLGFGAASGYGFYQAKKEIAAGRVLGGVLLANLSASVVDNVTAGEGPFSYLGFTLPLLRIEVATPLARRPRALLNLTVSPRDALSLGMTIAKGGRPFVRGGMLGFAAEEPLAANVLGWAIGIFPTVVDGEPEYVYRHEMVHVVQSLQLMAASPEPFLKDHRRDEGKMKLFSFGGVRAQALGLVNDLTLAKLQSYNSYWKEAEAYCLVAAK